MTSLLLLAVDWNALGQSSAAAFVAGTGVTLSFSLAIYGASRGAEARRNGESGIAVLAWIVMVAGLAVSLAAVAGAIWLMLEG